VQVGTAGARARQGLLAASSRTRSLSVRFVERDRAFNIAGLVENPNFSTAKARAVLETRGASTDRRDNGRRFIVRADKKLTAFRELESETVEGRAD
jgi:hypothetical protein